MTGTAPSREFEPPPRRFEDREGREVVVREVDGFEGETPPDDYETLGTLVEMYEAFDPADRAQGIPPTREEAIREWLGGILRADCVNVVAVVEGRVVGHATLVPDGESAYELAIFVLSEYQGAGIGTGLVTGLLGAGREAGVERVWLTVERWNAPAQALYRKVGFEDAGSGGFELEMTLRLADDGTDAGTGGGSGAGGESGP